MNLPTRSWTREEFWNEAQRQASDPDGILKFFLDLVQSVALTGIKYQAEEVGDGSPGANIFGLKPEGNIAMSSSGRNYYLATADRWIALRFEITPAVARFMTADATFGIPDLGTSSLWTTPAILSEATANNFRYLRVSANFNETDIYFKDILVNYLSGDVFFEDFSSTGWQSKIANMGNTSLSRELAPHVWPGSDYALRSIINTGSHTDLLIDLGQEMDRNSSNINVVVLVSYPYSQYVDDPWWSTVNKVDLRLYPATGYGYKGTYKPQHHAQPYTDDDQFLENIEVISSVGTPSWVDEDKTWFFDDFIVDCESPEWVDVETYFGDDFLNTRYHPEWLRYGRFLEDDFEGGVFNPQWNNDFEGVYNLGEYFESFVNMNFYVHDRLDAQPDDPWFNPSYTGANFRAFGSDVALACSALQAITSIGDSFTVIPEYEDWMFEAEIIMDNNLSSDLGMIRADTGMGQVRLKYAPETGLLEFELGSTLIASTVIAYGVNKKIKIRMVRTDGVIRAYWNEGSGFTDMGGELVNSTIVDNMLILYSSNVGIMYITAQAESGLPWRKYWTGGNYVAYRGTNSFEPLMSAGYNVQDDFEFIASIILGEEDTGNTLIKFQVFDTPMATVKVAVGWDAGQVRWYVGGVEQNTAVMEHAALKPVPVKIRRVSGTITGSYWDHSTQEWTDFATTHVDSDPVIIRLQGADQNGWGFFHLSTDLNFLDFPTGTEVWDDFWTTIGFDSYFNQHQKDEAPLYGGLITRNLDTPASMSIPIVSLNGDLSIEYSYHYTKVYGAVNGGIIVKLESVGSDSVQVNIRDTGSGDKFVIRPIIGGSPATDIEISDVLSVGNDYFIKMERKEDTLYVYFATTIYGEDPQWLNVVYTYDLSHMADAVSLVIEEEVDTWGDGFNYLRMQAEQGFPELFDYFSLWNSFWTTEVTSTFTREEALNSPIDAGLAHQKFPERFDYKIADPSGNFKIQYGVEVPAVICGWEIRYDADNYVKVFFTEDLKLSVSVYESGSEVEASDVTTGLTRGDDLFVEIARTGSLLTVQYATELDVDDDPNWIGTPYSYDLGSAMPIGAFELRIFRS